MNMLIEFFGCGKVSTRSNFDRCDFYIQDFNNIFNVVLPHFENYPLHNIKSLDLADFNKAANLFKTKGRAETSAIKEIISGMNSKR